MLNKVSCEKTQLAVNSRELSLFCIGFFMHAFFSIFSET